MKRWNAVLDCGMVAFLPLLMAYALVGEQAHEWLGAAMFLLFLGHHALNWSWYRSLRQGKWPPVRIFQAAVNAALLLAMIGLMVSGIMLSRYLFSFLPMRSGRSFARTLHMLSAYWGFCLMSLHLGIHWNMVLVMGRKLIDRPICGGKTILRIGAVLMAVWGGWAFVRRQIGTYMLLQTSFVFFDFEEPLALFLLDHLAVMGLFAVLGYYIMKGFSKR